MDFAPPLALRVSPDEARTLPNDPGHPSALVMAHGSMQVRWYRPQVDVAHLPHDRDEVYFVVSGTASFHRDNGGLPFEENTPGVEGRQRVLVRPGDVLFVPAGSPHDFEAMSDDFAVWAVFYGPEGGETP